MKLLALKCPQCGQRLEPHHNEAVVVGCTNCHTAVRLTQTNLTEIPVHYATPAKEKVDAWLPFWVFDGRVHIQERQVQGSSKGADKDAAKMWGQPRRLYAPAWNIRAGEARSMGGFLTRKQPDLQAVPRPENALVQEAIITPEDGLKVLDYIVLSMEARRKDMLRDLRFKIEVGQPELWAIPAQKKGKSWELVTVQ
ncbi:MAG: hypothetical protein GY796_17440 [Chloroflexi bacterium]|nr:hypothetical protein [Chloroflexota bacterium]